MVKIIKNFLQGLVFGMSGTIPAVSGGTIAIILGFYGELLEAVSHFAENRRKYVKFLSALFIGIIAGLVLFSSVIDYMLKHFSFPTMMFFAGLITGTVPLTYIDATEQGLGLKEAAFILTPLIALVILAHVKLPFNADPAEIINNISIPFILFMFLVGVLSGASFMVPGISGSELQLVLGVYPLVIYSISSIGPLLADITNVPLLTGIAAVLAPLGIGTIIGALFAAKMVEKFLKNHRQATYSVILGLLLGSIYVLFMNPIVYQSYKSGLPTLIVIIGIVTFLLGGVISFNFGGKGKG